jgi:hypothetical protein
MGRGVMDEFEKWFKYKYRGFYSNGADKRTDFTDYELKECWNDAVQVERKRLDEVWFEVTKKQLDEKDKEIAELKQKLEEKTVELWKTIQWDEE